MLKEHPVKNWNEQSLQKLLKNLDTDSVDGHPWSGRPQCARTAQNYDLVGDIMFSHGGAPQTHQSVIEISSNTGIHRLSDGHIIRDLFRATHPEENNMPVWLLT